MSGLVIAAGALLAITMIPYVAYGGLYLWIRPNESPATKQAIEPSISVVLPTYNEASIVERKLEDICAQDYPLDRVELIVVDASEDGTATIVESAMAGRENPDLVLLREPERRGVATAINRAIETASGEVVFRTDCDSTLAPDAIREAVKNLADPRVGAVTGRQSEVLGGSRVESEYRGLLARLQLLESHLDSTFICHGPCMAVEKAECAPIDPNSLADDTELALNVREGGKRVVMDPKIRFAESGTSSFTGRRGRKDRRAIGLVHLLIQRRKLLGRHGRYGWVVLPFNWWFMIVSPWLLLVASLLMVGAAVSAFGPTGLVSVLAFASFIWLGQRNILGPLQPLHAVVDAQVSLLIAAVRLVTDEQTGIWTIDRSSREAFK